MGGNRPGPPAARAPLAIRSESRRCAASLVGWLVWLVGSFVCLFGWLVGWLVCLFGWLVGLFVCLFGWFG